MSAADDWSGGLIHCAVVAAFARHAGVDSRRSFRILYVLYVYLLPTGFWRYHNVHYWTFTFPGFALLGFQLLHDLGGPSRIAAVGALIVVLALLCIRLDPVLAEPDEPAHALIYPWAHATLTRFTSALSALRTRRVRSRTFVRRGPFHYQQACACWP